MTQFYFQALFVVYFDTAWDFLSLLKSFKKVSHEDMIFLDMIFLTWKVMQSMAGLRIEF